MKRKAIFCLLLLAVFCLAAPAVADEAGVLTEGELSRWVSQVLLQTRGLEPQNAPVGEEALTEEGYAFLYPFATLYYNKPELDINSVLQGFAITDEAAETPRGLHLGSPAEALIATYGWQNTELFGDGSFAVLYRLSQFPQGAYWAWARLVDGALSSVQCAVHAAVEQSHAYTDAGVLYGVEDDAITSIRVYGLSQMITVADVESNLRAVTSVQAASSGDEYVAAALDPVAQGYFQKTEHAAFGAEDLRFGQVDMIAITEAGAALAFGAPQGEDWVQDDTGEWLRTVHHEGATLTYILDGNRQNSRLESLSLTGSGLGGPRGIAVGDSLEKALGQMRSDGTGQVLAQEAVLYGDGETAPYGTMATMGATATLRYVASAQGADGVVYEFTLRMAFENDQLTEILIYSW